MRRNLPPEVLVGLLERPLNAVLAFHREDGSIAQRPVWFRWVDGHVEFQIPAGDRKISSLERDPRVHLLIAENEHPYRALEVRGLARLTTDAYHERARSICERYVQAYDPNRAVDDYLSTGPGAVVEVVADRIAGWDYADETMV